MQKTEDLVEKADAFVEENQELVGDASASVLGRILVQGAPIATQLADEVTKSAAVAVEVANKLTDALNKDSVPPKQLAQHELRHKRAKAEYDRVNDAMTRFVDFMTSVQAAYNESAIAQEFAMTGKEPIAVMGPWTELPSRPQPPKQSLWRRLFR